MAVSKKEYDEVVQKASARRFKKVADYIEKKLDDALRQEKTSIIVEENDEMPFLWEVCTSDNGQFNPKELEEELRRRYASCGIR